MSEQDGATLEEQLLDAARRNNVDLLEHVYDRLEEDAAKIADLINTARDPLGNTALHLCCRNGSWDVLDSLLDQEGGIEIDPQNVADGDTPLHAAVRYALDEPEHGTFIVRNLVDVGADARIRNNHRQKPLDLIHGGDEVETLIDLLQGAELAADNDGSEEEEVEDDVEDFDEDGVEDENAK